MKKKNYTDAGQEPGGFLQWEEYDLSKQKVTGASSCFSTDNLGKMSHRMQTRWPTRRVAFIVF